MGGPFVVFICLSCNGDAITNRFDLQLVLDVARKLQVNIGAVVVYFKLCRVAVWRRIKVIDAVGYPL